MRKYFILTVLAVAAALSAKALTYMSTERLHTAKTVKVIQNQGKITLLMKGVWWL